MEGPLTPVANQAKQWLAFQEPITFDAARERILGANRNDGARNDIQLAKLKSWAFGSRDGHTMQLGQVPLPGRPERDPLVLREHAFRQLCTTLGVPAKYIAKLPRKLQEACMNYALVTDGDRDAMLRCAGDEARALVSTKYALAITDEMVLDTIERVLIDAGLINAAMVRSIGTGTSTVLRITFPSDSKPVKVGDVFETGIDVGNSELGLSTAYVCPISYRLVCTNGMRAWKAAGSALRVRHIGDSETLRQRFHEGVPVALAEANGQLDLWKRAAETLVDSALDEIDALRNWGVSASDVVHIGRTFARDTHGLADWEPEPKRLTAIAGPADVYSIANAITATAKERDSIEGRLEMEALGHRYLKKAAA